MRRLLLLVILSTTCFHSIGQDLGQMTPNRFSYASLGARFP